jgi:hypothetical protein
LWAATAALRLRAILPFAERCQRVAKILLKLNIRLFPDDPQKFLAVSLVTPSCMLKSSIRDVGFSVVPSAAAFAIWRNCSMVRQKLQVTALLRASPPAQCCKS